MRPANRQTWVDVYDPETGHYKDYPLLSDGVSELSSPPNDARKEAVGQDTVISCSSGSNHIDTPKESQEANSDKPAEEKTGPKSGLTHFTAKNASSQLKIGMHHSRWAPQQEVPEAKLKSEINQGCSSTESFEIISVKANVQYNGVRVVTPDSKGEMAPVERDSKAKIPTESYDSDEDSYKYEAGLLRGPRSEPWNDVRPVSVKLDNCNLKANSDLDTEPSTEPSESLKEYVKCWVQTTHTIAADLFPEGIEEPQRCDVDPMTGRLMSPLIYPSTEPGTYMSSYAHIYVLIIEI